MSFDTVSVHPQGYQEMQSKVISPCDGSPSAQEQEAKMEDAHPPHLANEMILANGAFNDDAASGTPSAEEYL